jgi:hypothetical protein
MAHYHLASIKRQIQMMIEQVLIIIGATIFGTLGCIHLLYTLFSNKFDPYKQAATEAMKSTHPKLTKQTSVYRAWIGFNASHSLGMIVVAAFYIPLALVAMPLIVSLTWFSLLPVVTGLSYLLLAKKYWFNIPFVGIFSATVCFALAALLINI